MRKNSVEICLFLGCLALHKLNLQYLTLYDYLLRNFSLFRLESTCNDFFVIRTFSDYIFVVFLFSDEIRQDVEDILFRMKPWKHEQADSDVVFGGWARMALPITTFSIVEVDLNLRFLIKFYNQKIF